MPSPQTQIVRFDALRSLAFSSLSGSFTAVGTPFGFPMRLLKIINNTNADVTISFDGTTSNDYVPANSFTLYDLVTNKILQDIRFSFSIGTQVYASTAGSPTQGNVYVVGIYGKGDY